MTPAQRAPRLTREDLLRLEYDRVSRNTMLAMFGGMSAVYFFFAAVMIRESLDLVRSGTSNALIVEVMKVIAHFLIYPLFYALMLFLAFHPRMAGIQRFFARHSSRSRPPTPSTIAFLRWMPRVAVALMFPACMFWMADIEGVQPPELPLIILAGGLITLGLFRRTGHRITCARCAYPWARTPNCPECGREYTDYRDLRMGTRTRSPARIALGLICLAAGVALALL